MFLVFGEQYTGPQSSTGVQLGIAYVSAPTALWNIVNSIADSEGEFPLQTQTAPGKQTPSSITLPPVNITGEVKSSGLCYHLPLHQCPKLLHLKKML